MVVISIIAILSTIGLTVYTTAQRAARDGKRKADILEIQKALEQYYALKREYPNSTGIYSLSTISNASYFSSGSTPKDPKSNNYIYAQGGTCTSIPPNKYVLCTTVLETEDGNRGALPGDGCSPVTDNGNPKKYFCVGSISN